MNSYDKKATSKRPIYLSIVAGFLLLFIFANFFLKGDGGTPYYPPVTTQVRGAGLALWNKNPQLFCSGSCCSERHFQGHWDCQIHATHTEQSSYCDRRARKPRSGCSTWFPYSVCRLGYLLLPCMNLIPRPQSIWGCHGWLPVCRTAFQSS